MFRLGFPKWFHFDWLGEEGGWGEQTSMAWGLGAVWKGMLQGGWPLGPSLVPTKPLLPDHPLATTDMRFASATVEYRVTRAWSRLLRLN